LVNVKDVYLYLRAIALYNALEALGSAASYPPFKKLGLNLRRISHLRVAPYYKDFSDYAAGKEFFDITYDQASYLFDPYEYSELSRYITPAMVAKRVDEILAGIK